MTGRVYLVGAGCGSYDLITLRGKRLLESCDAVVYDALIDQRLLLYAPDSAELICVGKRAGGHSAEQDEINSQLVSLAEQGKTVVRLKGGDPFVFGRGSEELEALSEAGIKAEVIPGISSCIAAPELAGMAVTARGKARSFHVITAHTQEGDADFKKYASLGGTLVFLMGLGALEKLSRGLTEGGMSPETPAAVVSNGARNSQRTVLGTLEDIAEKTHSAGLTAPAVTVVGNTADRQLFTPQRLPLSGVTAALTGSRRFCRRLADGLCALGAEVSLAALSEVKLSGAAMPDLTGYSWIILTSPVGAELFINELCTRRYDLRRLHGIKIAAVGRATAETLEAAGLYPDLIPEKYTAEALGKELCQISGSKDKVLILRAEKGTEALTDALAEGGISFDDIRLYGMSHRLIKTEITDSYIVFPSADTALSFFENGGHISPDTKSVCIGEVTAERLEKLGITEYLTAETATAEGIINTILKDSEHI